MDTCECSAIMFDFLSTGSSVANELMFNPTEDKGPQSASATNLEEMPTFEVNMPTFEVNSMIKTVSSHLPHSFKSSVNIAENKGRQDLKTEKRKEYYYRNPLCKLSKLTPQRILMLLRSRSLCGWKVSKMRFGLG